MARAGSDTDLSSEEHSEFCGRPVTELVTTRAESVTDFPRGGILRICRPTGHEVSDDTGR